MASGWIKLHRQLLDSNVFTNPLLLKVWIWCLLKASSKATDSIYGRSKVPIKNGQFTTGRKAASSELNMAESTFYDYMRLLQELGMISMKSDNKKTLVTIENWEFFQNKDKKSNNKSDSKSDNRRDNKSDNSSDTYKNSKEYKEYREEKEEYVCDIDDDEWMTPEELMERVKNGTIRV